MVAAAVPTVGFPAAAVGERSGLRKGVRVGRKIPSLGFALALVLMLAVLLPALLETLGCTSTTPESASLADALFRRGGRRFLRKKLDGSRKYYDDEDGSAARATACRGDTEVTAVAAGGVEATATEEED
eukprot:CAMPEP_0170610666 /NCGR_PEP_ID=MMETSP0224-20130122/22781_1 /TAXON_ID=285029 /ORGANISM="Togula jolla, Strain CCCM 725" /LENGTH=128 /DNA_ID=CAMNT_0010936057 /DNA_START=1 /DNA_END=388 /DNA_ORIENTATION=+